MSRTILTDDPTNPLAAQLREMEGDMWDLFRSELELFDKEVTNFRICLREHYSRNFTPTCEMPETFTIRYMGEGERYGILDIRFEERHIDDFNNRRKFKLLIVEIYLSEMMGHKPLGKWTLVTKRGKIHAFKDRRTLWQKLMRRPLLPANEIPTNKLAAY